MCFWNMDYASTGFWVSLHLDENKAQSQTIHLFKKKQQKKHPPEVWFTFSLLGVLVRTEAEFYGLDWCRRNGVVLMGEYVALMCSWWVSRDLLPARRWSQKQSHGLKRGKALKPEIDDSLGCACAWVCVLSCNLIWHICLCVLGVAQNTCESLMRVLQLCIPVWLYLCMCVISLVNACTNTHTLNKSVYECALYSPAPTLPFWGFLSCNFPLLVTSGSPMIPRSFWAGPWLRDSLTESCVVQAWSCLGARLVLCK